ncbi:MAG: proton-conducting transporter membrane subunit, partial [Candidatus Cloacimonadaceae bacterium]|nr:proton-conducting transporter membrane subunit [Candidatus Cloacimonadaceae bacterium]
SAPSLVYDRVLQSIRQINPFWLKVSFVFMLIGFGTKLGLAPMHFWLPDAHSEAPAPVSALLSGALLNTALLPLIRMQSLMEAADLGSIAAQMFQVLGFLSLFIAAVFIVKIKNYKRLLAYSSIENMGLIMIAFGIGGATSKIGLIHVMGHSLIKASFFLTAGNAYHIYAQKEYDKCGGLLDAHAPSGWLWLISFMFIVGMPPSPLFFSEFGIAVNLLARGNIAGVLIYFLLLASIAYGLGRASLAVTMGSSDRRVRIPLLHWLPQAVMLLLAAGVPYFLYLSIG